MGVSRSCGPIVVCSLWLGCSSCGGAAAPQPVPVPQPSARGGEAVPAPTPYDVHEWGLVRATAGDLLSVGAIAPPVVVEPIAVDKPVLYFHADAPVRLRSVSVDAREGAIVEAWPVTPRTNVAAALEWRDVSIEPGAACQPSPLPRVTDLACTSLPAGDLCETASLATVRVPGAPCLHVAGATDSLLFYRARSRTFTPPLRFQRRHVYAEVDVTNDGDQPIPGWLVRLHDEHGRVRALAVRPPGPHATIVVGADFAPPPRATDQPPAADARAALQSNVEPGRNAVRESMRELGMTDGETAAFLRAWDESLFGLAPAAASDRTAPGAVDELSADGLPAPRETFLYFLPAADCDRVARLSFDPPPRTVRRAIAVWSVLRPTGASH